MHVNFDTNNHYVPVVRRPRQEWRIPRIDAHARLLQQQQEEARLKALTEGTTPQGREALCKILLRTERLLQSQPQALSQVVDAIEAELNTLKLLQPEFALLLHRSWGGKLDYWQQASPRSLAKLVVIVTAYAPKIKAEEAGLSQGPEGTVLPNQARQESQPLHR
jgi:hypothetical protein